MGRGQEISTLAWVWKKLIPALTGGFKEFKTSVQEITADVMSIKKTGMIGGA